MHFQLSLLKNRYPESERSVGDFITKAGDKNCYDAKGPVREMFLNSGLEASIRNLLNNRTTELYAGEKTHETLKYGIFMIGKTPQKTHPTIMLCCQAENPRRRAKKMILDEKILDDYLGVKIRNCDDSTLLFASQDLEVASTPENAESQTQIVCRRSRLTEDRRIFIKTHTESSTLRKVSRGNVLQIQDEYFYTTVSHAFTSSTKLQMTNESNASSREFGLCLDSDSDTDEDDFINDIEEEEEGDEDFIDATSLGSLTPGYADSETSSDTESDTFPQFEVFDNQDDEIKMFNSSNIFSEDHINNTWAEEIVLNQVPNHHDGASDKHLTPLQQSAEDEQLSVLGEQHLSSKDGPNPNLDYMLIKVSEDEANCMKDQENNAVFEVTLDRDQSWIVQTPTRIAVTTTTGSGSVLSGKLLGTPTFLMLPGSTVFQEVWTMQHNGTLLDGDCGSWVVDAKNGKLVGHIIAGSRRTSLAYIIPFRYIIADISERFGREVALSNKLISSTKQNPHDNTRHIEMFNDSLLSSLDLSDSRSGYNWDEQSNIFQLLYEGANDNAPVGLYDTSLQVASQTASRWLGYNWDKHRNIVQVLLDAGASFNAPADLGGTTFQGASLWYGYSRGEQSNIVQMPLDAGADINASAGLYTTTLQEASRWDEGPDQEVEDEISLKGNKFSSSQSQETAKWLLETPQYQLWVNEGPCRLLWIQGNPGKGKSILASYLGLQRMQKSSHSGQHLIFCDFLLLETMNSQQTIIDMLYSIFLKQNIVLMSIENEGNSPSYKRPSISDDLWSVRTHPAHQKPYRADNLTDQEPALSVNRLRTQEFDKFKMQYDIISAITGHKHLARLIATYERDSDSHLRFAYAKVNLCNYWAQTTHWNQATYILILGQIHGITSGLAMVHCINGSGSFLNISDNQRGGPEHCGRHGDIKPENLLYLNDLGGASKEGVLHIVVDKGTSRFHCVHSRSSVNQFSGPGLPSYVPPELGPKLNIFHACDTWSLSCVFLGVMTWLTSEPQELEDFLSARGKTALDPAFKDNRFFSITSPRINTILGDNIGVPEWTDELRLSERCLPVIHYLHSLEQNQMLLINAKLWIHIKSSKVELEHLLNKLKMMSQRSRVISNGYPLAL